MSLLRALLLGMTLVTAIHAQGLPPIQIVFVIVLENHDWASIHGSPDAPYINDTLLPMASFCEQYYNPPGLHPSLPNYLWLEAGTNFGIVDDNNPSVNHQATTNHLVALLNNAGISWRTYQEDIIAGYVPLQNTNGYAVRHNPFVYFDDVTGTNNPGYAYGIAHIRPFSELAGHLASNNIARYNFIVPNNCHGGHDTCEPTTNAVRQTDNWLATVIPGILSSSSYSNNGAIFITWDEDDGAAGIAPIGMIVLSPLARGGGYFNNLRYTHSSFLRTMQEIFGVKPLLGDAVNATSLSDLFTKFSISSSVKSTNGAFRMTVTGVVPGRTNILEASTNLTTWNVMSTNISTTNNFSVLESTATNHNQRFYRVKEVR